MTGGGSLRHWVNEQYLASLRLPEVHIHDRDTETPPKHKKLIDEVNARGDGHWACLTKKREMENYFHPAAVAEALKLAIIERALFILTHQIADADPSDLTLAAGVASQ